MNTVKGLPEFLRRVSAIQRTPKPVAQAWADGTVDAMRQNVRKRTGRTARSFRHTPVTATGSKVVGSQVANVLESGARAHDEVAHGSAMRYDSGRGGRTMFSRRVHHPRSRAYPFKRKSLEQGLTKANFPAIVAKEWNGAA